jgi:predicted metal-dependent phosphoesterase TrpH
MPFANFHIHTAFSDGAISPDDLVDTIIQERGLNYFALTDHDTLSGIEPLFRSLKSRGSLARLQRVRFVPGVEISLREEKTKATVHLIGLFPGMTLTNCEDELRRIDEQLGDFCRERGLSRGLRDLDGRIRRAFDLNLDGLADRHEAVEEVIGFLRGRAEEKNRDIFEKAGKGQDVIQHPIPFTYQTIIDHWEELVPHSTREIVMLYILRPDRQKAERLTNLYRSQGMNEAEASHLGKTNQAILCRIANPASNDKGIFDGLDLLKKAGAVSLLVHPAIDHDGSGYDDFDHHVLYPLMERGLDGIEVYYPYDPSYRAQAIDHYAKIAHKHGMLISGGTDFHGDGRIGLSDVKLPEEDALRIIHSRK